MTDNDTTPQNLRPVCFVIMPYGRKPTMSESGPVTIDYDTLWYKAFKPAIEQELKYTAIRADQDLGAMIIVEMIERLALSDLVIADISTPNTNVYYEVGIRHAAKATGCVLISADWAKQPFDTAQMRQLRYPLPEGDITDETAKAVFEKLKTGVKLMIDGTSPVFESLTGFPGKVDLRHTSSFKKFVGEISQFSAELGTIRITPTEKKDELINSLLQRYNESIASMPGIAMEIMYLLRDSAKWQQLSDFIKLLPDTQKQIPVVKEVEALAISKTGNHESAIAGFQELIKTNGDTSERRGLIGGRYKKIYLETKEKTYLSKAIAEYDLGMRLDLNDYYPSCNLPQLYRLRAMPGDDKKATSAAIVALMATQRAEKIDPSDKWLLPTQLRMAFEAKDVDKVNDLYIKMEESGAQPFQLQTTLADIAVTLDMIKNDPEHEALSTVFEALKQMQ